MNLGVSRDSTFRCLNDSVFGEVAEWFKAAVLKTAGGYCPSVGSNPTLTSMKKVPHGGRMVRH